MSTSKLSALARPMLQLDFWKRVVTSTWFAVAFFVIITAIYFLPILIRVNVYIPGGDAMYNAWVMERNQHCMLREHCPVYTDANIYFPNKDSMLYSETEISPSVVTMPIHLLNQNPIIAYNIITVASFFMAGWSMYLLARYLSKGSALFGLAIGAVFEFAPIMLAATHNLQNLSIFCLPLAAYFIFKYLDTTYKKYLVGLFLSLVYVFYASFYQMVFTIIGVGVLFVTLWFIRKQYKALLIVGGVIFAACVAVAPLAKVYLNFSPGKNNNDYNVIKKIVNSSSAQNYVVPPDYTLAGRLYNRINTEPRFHPDALTYAGVSLYVLAIASGIVAYRQRKKLQRELGKLYVMFAGLGVAGFVLSLGPYLKVHGEYLYKVAGDHVAIPMPFWFIDTYVPALGFLRGPARFGVLLIFALCCLLALFVAQLATLSWYKKRAVWINIGIVLLLAIDLLPLHMVPLSTNPHSFSHGVPAIYQYIKDHPEIDNIVILQAKDYPNVDFWFARTETVLWSGYHNRNIYNGYSGYVPPTYESEYSDFVNLDPSDPDKMRARGLRYVVVDTELYTNKPEVLQVVPSILGDKPIYSDSRYKLYKL